MSFDITVCVLLRSVHKHANSGSNRAAKVKVKSTPEQDRGARPGLRLSGVGQTKKDQFNLLSSGQAHQVIYAGIAWTWLSLDAAGLSAGLIWAEL